MTTNNKETVRLLLRRVVRVLDSVAHYMTKYAPYITVVVLTVFGLKEMT